jgi:hypothetical protein
LFLALFEEKLNKLFGQLSISRISSIRPYQIPTGIRQCNQVSGRIPDSVSEPGLWIQIDSIRIRIQHFCSIRIRRKIAFVTVPHERLKKKLKAHGIDGKLLAWIAAWLEGRWRRIVLNGCESTWEQVLSGVPQGSVLGPLLFLIFINDLDAVAGIAEWILKFADDTKAARVINSDEDRQSLQAALDSIVNWSVTGGMRFNIKKCKVMHLGRRNNNYVYEMAGQKLDKTREEKDLGVIISDNLKPAAQCAKAAKRAQTVLGQISRAFLYRDRTVFMQLYKQYVRPHLEFSVQAWAPYNAADVEALKKVQKKAVKMVSGLRSQEYADRLKELRLTTLSERRHQADMLMMYKLRHGHGKLDDEGGTLIR